MSDFLPVPAIEGSIQRDDKDFNVLSSGSSFLPRLQLAQAGSDAVKENKISRGGVWMFIADKDKPEDLGVAVDVAVLDWRSKAVHFKNNQPQASSFNMHEPLFTEIMVGAENQKQGDDDTYMYGPEFLVWVPSAKNGLGAFAGFFCSSKTNRKVAPDVRALVGKTATLASKFIKTQKFSWFGFSCVPCSTGLAAKPTEDEIVRVVTAFRNPPKDDKEKAAAAALDR